MKYIRRVYRYLFDHDRHDISLLIFAAAAAVSGSGIVAVALWIVHAPVAATAKATCQTCLESCRTRCGGYVRQ